MARHSELSEAELEKLVTVLSELSEFLVRFAIEKLNKKKSDG